MCGPHPHVVLILELCGYRTRTRTPTSKSIVQMTTNPQKINFFFFFLILLGISCHLNSTLDVRITVGVRTFLGFECGVRSAQWACGPHSRTVVVALIASVYLLYLSEISKVTE